MKTIISEQFLNAFERGGVVDKCIDYVNYTHQIDYPSDMISREWDGYYKERLPEKIREEAKLFDDSVIDGNVSPLMNEIEANLNECRDDNAKQRYLFSLLKPFKRLSDVFYPLAEIQYLEKDILETKEDAKFWSTHKPNGYKSQLKACDEYVSRREIEIGNLKDRASQFIKIIGQEFHDPESVEEILHQFVGVKYTFANRLDALLLQYDINLFDLQNECGIYLKITRDITEIAPYIGSFKLAEKYLPKKQTQEESAATIDEDKNGSLLTPKLSNKNIDELKEYFRAPFKGIGTGSTDYFSQLVEDLQKPRTGKQFSAIACLIYENKVLTPNKRPNTFEGWKRIFHDLLGIENNKYHRNHLESEIEKLKYEFRYLETDLSIKVKI